MTSVCLLSTGQPATNPRLVKEADALSEAGFHVRAICAHWAHWARHADVELARSRRWRFAYVGGRPGEVSVTYAKTRLRTAIARRMALLVGAPEYVRLSAISRVTPELLAAARATPSDLYIAHTLGALPAAVEAAGYHGARAGFDAEDFHSGMFEERDGPSAHRRLVEQIESRYLGRCSHLTAATPEFGEKYAERYAIARPATVLNVFPLAQRPHGQRPPSNGRLRLYWFSQTIGPKRGLEEIVEAMGKLGDRRIELHLRGDWQGGYADRLYRVAAEHAVARERIVSHPPASPDRMVRLAAAYDVGLSLEQPVSPNRDLCLSNKLFTYLLAGNAVLATRTTAQARLAESLDGAVATYPPGDVSALTGLLRGWLENRERLNAARSAAWRAGSRRYNWDVEKERLLEAVDKALSG